MQQDTTNRWDQLVAESYADAKKNGRFRIFPVLAEQCNLPIPALREWMERNDNDLAHCVTDVPSHWRKISMPDMRYPGECFSRAIQFLTRFGPRKSQEHNAVYIIGQAIPGGIGQHGWVELEDRIVFDGVQQQFYTKKGYYDTAHATPWYRFTRPAVVALQRRKQFAANLRWHYLLDLPWADDPANPLTITLDMVKERLSTR